MRLTRARASLKQTVTDIHSYCPQLSHCDCLRLQPLLQIGLPLFPLCLPEGNFILPSLFPVFGRRLPIRGMSSPSRAGRLFSFSFSFFHIRCISAFALVWHLASYLAVCVGRVRGPPSILDFSTSTIAAVSSNSVVCLDSFLASQLACHLPGLSPCFRFRTLADAPDSHEHPSCLFAFSSTIASMHLTQ